MIARALSRLRGRYRAWRDAELDRRYGVETAEAVHDVAVSGLAGQGPAHGNHYEPIQLDVFRRIMAALPLVPEEFAFVDFGSGKGRALFLAAEHGFRRVIGIEHSRALHEAAALNAKRFLARHPGLRPIELYYTDARAFEIPPEDAVCFFYNPFDAAGMSQVLGRLRGSLRAVPRRLYAVYRNPRHPEAFADCDFFEPLIRNSTFEVYVCTACNEESRRCGGASSATA